MQGTGPDAWPAPLPPAGSPMEMWAGIECTVNRVGDDWRDQLHATGVHDRLDDLDRLAALGVRRLRFPVLWERVAPEAPDRCDWSWSDAALARLRALGVSPIVGLLHHGSGPRYTHLLDERFPPLLADFARRVAERHPEQLAWTPVNEPVTTARFSALYGVWYPHRRDDTGFVRALLNEIHATAGAMREIRRVQPAAQLVQTDDLGHTRSTPALAYQADFDNTRRWLGFDLLCGRVDRHHPLWDYLVDHGATADELARLRDEPCPPDVIGVNAYVTSERFLDDRLHLHPEERHGGNGVHRYVDIETVRVHGQPIDGFAGRLREAHARYGLPLAITEVHLGCTREEQARWLQQAWQQASAARDDGVDVRAVTAWAAFGTMDWSSLLTQQRGDYEPGLFDVRSTPPRTTALGRVVEALARGQEAGHPVLQGTGWWHRDIRLEVDPIGAVVSRPLAGRPLLVTGAGGTLGRAFARLCHLRGLPHVLLSRHDMDIADPASVAAALARHQPWALVNTAGYVRVDDAESDERQWRENALGPVVLAAECARRGVRLVTFSSDLVFPGERAHPFVEGDETRPLNAYGRAKAHAEREVLVQDPQALVIRSAAFFGPWDRWNFVTQGLAALSRGERWHAADDQVVSPTYVPDLVNATLDLLVDGERGLWHLTHGEPVSWAEFARRVSEEARLEPGHVIGRSGSLLGQRAPRPDFCALRSERASLLPPLGDALRRYLRERETAID